MPRPKGVVTCGARTLVAKTCLSCGLLKEAAAYSMKHGKYRQSNCMSCTIVKGQPLLSLQKAASSDRATKHGQPWTEAEYVKLEEMRAEGKTYVEMAAELERTMGSVRNAIFKNHL